jgi:glutamate mutase epsilon subunit
MFYGFKHDDFTIVNLLERFCNGFPVDCSIAYSQMCISGAIVITHVHVNDFRWKPVDEILDLVIDVSMTNI